jgi:predicted transcriptional regulator
MVATYTQQTEKVTFNIPSELKAKATKLKDELHLSLSAIYNEAIAEYIRKKEIERWSRGVDMALRDQEYISQAQELGSDSGDVYEYK